MSPALIAPCGMNCRLCIAHVRARNTCPGCRDDTVPKLPTRWVCRIKTCEKIASGGAEFCFECGDFPCARLKYLDKRYRTKYGMSMIGNLEYLRDSGMERFLAHEAERWTCPGCGGVLSVHKPECLSCGRRWR